MSNLLNINHSDRVEFLSNIIFAMGTVGNQFQQIYYIKCFTDKAVKGMFISQIHNLKYKLVFPLLIFNFRKLVKLC